MTVVEARTEPVPGLHKALRLELWQDQPLSWSDVARGLRDDAAVRLALSRAIVDAQLDGLFWECVPVSRETRYKPFSCMLIDSPAVARLQTDRRPFSHQLGSATEPDVLVFGNLGGDAVLVVPAAEGRPASHAHLAAFLRTASPEQVSMLWQRVGAGVRRWWAERTAPVWVSTSGLGVSWLHVRLDRRPKYYTWRPFRAAPG